jgi:hypothetical protein
MQIALIAPRPLDALEIPAALDGRDGINRAPGRRQIAANDDLSAIRAWLARVVETKTTFENYARSRAPAAWSLVEIGKPLSSLTHEDLPRISAFSPIRNARALGRQRPQVRDDPRWRPFHGPLAPPASVRPS